MSRATGYAVQDATTPLAPFSFDRRSLQPCDVAFDIKYCGVCHSDLHTARGDWENALYPVVPGHEIVGVVTAIGDAVTKVKIGDRVAVGCMVDSCQACDQCENGTEQFCRDGFTMTYNGRERQGGVSYGGYSDHIVVREEFILKVPDSLDLARAAPLLCAGITTYSPLKKWSVGPGTRVAVIGLGGLGHVAVKLAVGLGARVTVVTSSPDKSQDSLALGADAVLCSGDRPSMKLAAASFDVIIDTIPVAHDIGPYLSLLDVDGTLVLVGAIAPLPNVHGWKLISMNRRVVGSHIGGIAETQEMLDFCAEKNIHCEVEMIAIQDVDEAWERMKKGAVKYRFVIDMASLTHSEGHALAEKAGTDGINY